MEHKDVLEELFENEKLATADSELELASIKEMLPIITEYIAKDENHFILDGNPMKVWEISDNKKDRFNGNINLPTNKQFIGIRCSGELFYFSYLIRTSTRSYETRCDIYDIMEMTDPDSDSNLFEFFRIIMIKILKSYKHPIKDSWIKNSNGSAISELDSQTDWKIKPIKAPR